MSMHSTLPDLVGPKQSQYFNLPRGLFLGTALAHVMGSGDCQGRIYSRESRKLVLCQAHESCVEEKAVGQGLS